MAFLPLSSRCIVACCPVSSFASLFYLGNKGVVYWRFAVNHLGTANGVARPGTTRSPARWPGTLVSREARWRQAGPEAPVFPQKHVALGKRRQLLFILREPYETSQHKGWRGWGEPPPGLQRGGRALGAPDSPAHVPPLGGGEGAARAGRPLCQGCPLQAGVPSCPDSWDLARLQAAARDKTPEPRIPAYPVGSEGKTPDIIRSVSERVESSQEMYYRQSWPLA